MRKVLAAVLTLPLLAAAANAQYGQGQYDQRQYDQRQYDQRQYDQRQYGRTQYDPQRHRQFYNGAYEGGRGGEYGYDRDGRYTQYDDRNRDYHRGGIGPGKGAAIGGAGGAVLGAIFGGGAKGALIGGAAGAGIGAIVGKENQNRQRNREYQPY